MRQVRNILVLATAFLILFPIPGMASSLLVSWNANSEDDLGGYKVYYGGQSQSYGQPIDVGNVQTYQISGLENGNTYYVAVTAYDTSGNESGFSREVQAYIPVPDTLPPTGSVIINAGDPTTPSRVVTLTLNATDTGGAVTGMKISNNMQTWSNQVAYSPTQQWVLTEGDGLKTVYVQFTDASGNWSTSASDTIELLLDSDGDGLPDSWENLHGLDPSNPQDAGMDSDQDGISNLEEYFEHSDPMDAADNAPVAQAGPDQTVPPTRVYLDGSASYDPNGDTLQYAWTQTAGPVQLAIESAASARAQFVGVKAGLYTLMLSCFDGKVSDTDTVNVTVLNVPPTVSAGPDLTVDAGGQVVLHATGSDPNEDPLSYQWSLAEGPAVLLPDLSQQDISLVLETEGLYRFTVRCSDGCTQSTPDEVYITVNAVNRAPTADAGLDIDVQAGTVVYLDGSRSTDPDGDTLQYLWTQTAGSQVTLSNAQTASPWFEAMQDGTLEFELRVSDGTVSSTPDTIVVRVLRLNTAPVAAAGEDIHAYVGEDVILDATGSYDPDEDPITFAWTQVSGATADLVGGTTTRPYFTPTTSGVLEFRVVVSDGEATSSDTVVVTVDSINQVPVSDAGENQVASPNETVVLDGRLSYDPDGDQISYIWSQLEGTRVSLGSSNTCCPSFTPTQTGQYLFELRVYDGKDTSTPDTVLVTVQEEDTAIVPSCPEMNSVEYRNPTFTWTSCSMDKYKLYLSINGGKYHKIYSGSSTSYTLHPILWYWFIPSGSTMSWYCEGYTSDSMVTSEIMRFTKK